MKNDTFGEPTVIKHKNITATVYSPILTEEEKNKRMNTIKKSAARLLAGRK